MVLDVPLSAIDRRTVDVMTAERASATSTSLDNLSSSHAMFSHKKSGGATQPTKLKILTRKPTNESLQQVQGTPVAVNYR